MKKLICMFVSLCLILALAGCGASGTKSVSTGKQTAAATFYLNDISADVSVDISGGWSIEFSTGAVYLYDGENDGQREAIAHGYIIDQAEYDENVTEYRDYESFTEVENGVKFSEGEGGSNKYLFAVGNGLYYMIAANQDADAEAIYARFEVKPGMS